MKVFFALTAALVVLAYGVFQLPPFGGSFDGERLARMQKSPQWAQGRFENSPKQNTDDSISKNFKLYNQGIPRDPIVDIPVMALSAQTLRSKPAPGLRAIWFGHATVLIEVDGVRVMTDPVLSERVSPFQWIGPKRFHAPPIELKNLTGIDAVVISHDHYDHLDQATITKLSQDGTIFYVGLGIGAHLERWKVPPNQIVEMDWWESTRIKGIEIHCTPTRHYSGRKKMDNSTLWASWTIKGPKHSFFFSGDTGYSKHFSEIAKKLGPIDLSLIKIGAYGETWLDIHMDPESAIQAHLDLGAKTMLPVHWATFDLSYHAWAEPIQRATLSARSKSVHLITPRIGEPFEFGAPFQNLNWFQN
ncbi:MAG: MBL fold metallo-hydrolase [Bdellovibrionales bacterium]|nr:MBL fold metallo-hydrolase [Bdellovibrionales bacterium]